MSDFCVCRVVGNELPPKDQPSHKIRALRHALEHDEMCEFQTLWVLNRIIDPAYEAEVQSILGEQQIVSIPFRQSEYRRCQSKIAYLTNINAARNLGIRESHKTCRYAVSLDQDCFFTPDLWNGATDRILQDDADLPFYMLISKRLTGEESFKDVPDGEPMVVIRNDAPYLFDESICFGNKDKLELLFKLGYSIPSETWKLDNVAGYVLHIGYDKEIESSVAHRCSLRDQGLQELVRRADSLASGRML